MKWVGILLVFLSSYRVCAQCNGFTPLCSKAYDEVAYLTTHNAFAASESGFSLPNQHLSITNQLELGVRALMIDLYDVSGTVTVYHGTSFTGSSSFVSNLNEIKTFLDLHPNEIVTIILESYVTPDAIEADLTTVGLMSYLFEKGTAPWPTLQEMIDAGTRLVIFSDKNDASPSQGWHHYLWDMAVETKFSYGHVSEFDCVLNRGDIVNDLFILNHFVTDSVYGIGVESQAEIANANPLFIDRCNECETMHSKFPNFLTVDFVELGDGLAVVNNVNDLGNLDINTVGLGEKYAIFQNSELATITISSNQSPFNGMYQLHDVSGRIIFSGRVEKETVFSTAMITNGIYFLVVLENGVAVKNEKLLLAN